MKVKLLVPRCGKDFTQNVGDEIEVSDAEGKRMLEAQPPQARPVRGTRKSKTKVEKAVQ